MKSGRSFCDGAARAPRRRGHRADPAGHRLALALTAGLALASSGRAIASPTEAIPPPPENPGSTPTPTPAPSRAAPKRAPCPRCGYLCDNEWRYCVACGWDRTMLVGQAEGALQAIARASVGVTVGGRRNRYATAFPLGGQGLLVTNARSLVAADDSSLKVRTYDNRLYPASVVGYDLPSGVGLLKAAIPNEGSLDVAPDSPSPPESAWAVCYPIAREDDLVRYMPVSLHRGRLTASAQSGTFLVSFERLLRTDHAIEEGCTGGPLVDRRGRVAGMILGSPEDGVTYVQPLEALQPIVAILARGERPTRPFFGVGLVAPDERRRAKFGIDPGTTQPLVGYLIPGSPAAQAGLKPGDVLKAVGGASVATVWEAGSRLLAVPLDGPGLTLTLERAGAERQATVRPVARPERVLLDPVDEIQETLEVNLEELTSGPGSQQGLRVSNLVRGGRGEQDHYRNGDLIVGVDKKTVRSFAAFDDVIHSRFKTIFDQGAGTGRFSSSYVLELEVRKEGDDGPTKVTREYVNLFPDFLAPPVY